MVSFEARPAKIVTGTYTGDGTTSQVITVAGLAEIKLVIAIDRQTVSTTAVSIALSTPEIVDDNAAGGAIAITTAANFVSDAIIAISGNTFTVDDGGTDADPNTSGQVYNYIAIGY